VFQLCACFFSFTDLLTKSTYCVLRAWIRNRGTGVVVFVSVSEFDCLDVRVIQLWLKEKEELGEKLLFRKMILNVLSVFAFFWWFWVFWSEKLMKERKRIMFVWFLVTDVTFWIVILPLLECVSPPFSEPMIECLNSDKLGLWWNSIGQKCP